MNRQWIRIGVALFLILIGTAALLDNIGLMPFAFLNVEWFWLVVFGLAGFIFLGVFVANLQDNWWAVIPGLTLIGLALLVGFGSVLGTLGGALFLGMIGVSFLVIYITRREFWWAVIPGGVLLTLALVAGISDSVNGIDTGGFFFLGLGLTFLIVYLIPTVDGRMRWAIWPAGALGIMGALLFAGSASLARFIWPVVLILFGGSLVVRALRAHAE